MSDTQDQLKNVEAVDQVFSKLRYITTFEKRVAQKKLPMIVSGESSLCKESIARSGVSVVSYLLIIRQARLLTEIPALVVGVALFHERLLRQAACSSH